MEGERKDEIRTSVCVRALNREGRQRCWRARDDLFQCLNNDTLEAEKEGSNCQELRDLLRATCPASWADHFLVKHRNDRQQEAAIERMGATSLKEALARGDAVLKQ